MSKQFGAVQNLQSQWQLHYVNSFHGSKNLCYGGPDSEPHDHSTSKEAEECKVGLSRINEQFKPFEMEAPEAYVAPKVEKSKVFVKVARSAGDREKILRASDGDIVVLDDPDVEVVKVPVTSTKDLADDVAVEVADDNESYEGESTTESEE